MSVHDATSGSLERAGARWTEGEYATVIEFLRNDAAVEEIAVALERSTTAIRAQLRQLVPVDKELNSSEREPWLREQLATSDRYDWRKALRDHYHAQGRHFFTDDHDAALRQAWSVRTPLTEMAQRVQGSEVQVVQRLIALGLARSTVDVTQHIDVAAGGTVDVRARLSADRAAFAMWVLVVDGAHGTPAVRPLRLKRHTSLHATHDNALQVLDRIIDYHDRDASDEIKWSIMERTVGGRPAGADYHGVYPPVDRAV